MDNNSQITSSVGNINPAVQSVNLINNVTENSTKSSTGSFFSKLRTYIIVFGILIAIFALCLLFTKGSNKQQQNIIPQNDGSTQGFDFFNSNNPNTNNPNGSANSLVSGQTLLSLTGKKPLEGILSEDPTSMPEDLSIFLSDFGKKNYRVYTDGSIDEKGVFITFSDKQYYFSKGQLVVTIESLTDGGGEKTILTKNNEIYTIQDKTRKKYFMASVRRPQGDFMDFKDWRNSHPLAIMYDELIKKKITVARDKYGMYDIDFPLKYIDVAYPSKQSAKILVDLESNMVKYLLLYRFIDGQKSPHILGKIKFNYEEISDVDLNKLRTIPNGYSGNAPVK